MSRPEITWTNSQGQPIACVEKLKVLKENFDEIEGLVQDALDDSVLMGCTQSQVKEYLHSLIDSITSPYQEL